MADTFTLAANGSTITINKPRYGYVSRILLPFSITRRSSGLYGVFDPGASFDNYECEATFELSLGQHADLLNFLQDAGKGRGAPIVMTLSAGSGFHPFSPYRGDVGPFTVYVDSPRIQGTGEAPFRYFETKLTFTHAGAFPTYSLPSDEDEGTVTIGTVGGVRFPPDWFKPLVQYRYSVSPSMGGTETQAIDRGSSADAYETRFNLDCNEAKASRILQYLVATTRSNSFTLTPPTDSYAFDYDKGDSGNYTVRWIQTQLEIIHVSARTWRFPLQLSWEATV